MYVRLFEENTENWWFSRYLHVSVVQGLQLSWNLQESPRFLESVLGPGWTYSLSWKLVYVDCRNAHCATYMHACCVQ